MLGEGCTKSTSEQIPEPTLVVDSSNEKSRTLKPGFEKEHVKTRLIQSPNILKKLDKPKRLQFMTKDMQKNQTVTKPTGEPSLIFDNPSFNFGEVEEGTVVEHVFKCKNVGKEKVTITNVRSS
jgi:hypothetical protein